MTHRLIIGLGCAFFASISAASGALAQTQDPAAPRSQAAVASEPGQPAIQLVQDRGPDRSRMRRGERPNRDEDDEDEADYGRGGPGGWRPGMFRQGMGQGVGQGMRPGMMREAIMAHALGGARIHLRRGDAAINVRCPPDVRLNECVDSVGRLLDRLSTMGTGTGASSGSTAPPPR